MVEHLHANREAIATATNFLDRHFGAVLYPATTATAARTVGAGYPSSWVTEQEQGQGMEEDGVDGDDNPFRPPPLLLDADQEAFERAAV